MEINYQLEGLQYDETRKKCRRELDRINGVHSVTIDQENNNIQVIYSWPATDVEINERIKSMGFDL